MLTYDMPLTQKDYEELRARNEARVKKLIEEMGTKYLCHPENFITKKKVKSKKLCKSKKIGLKT